MAADSTNISTPIPEPAETVSSAVAVEEESPVAASSEELSEEVATERSHEPATKESILAALKLLSEKEPAEITNEEVSRLKQQFYAIRNEEQRNEREAFVEAGNQPEAFQPTTDETEEAFKAILATVKEKKAEQRAAIEAEQQKNYERKKEIIDKIIEMGSDVDNANRFFQQVRDLQNEFKEIGEVPAPVAADLWKSYQDAVEKFYDQLKINKELATMISRRTFRKRNFLWPKPTSSVRKRMSSQRSAAFRNSTSSGVRSVLCPRKCVRKSGVASRIFLLKSTSATRHSSRSARPVSEKTSSLRRRSANASSHTNSTSFRPMPHGTR